jgi:hypothetical protein
MLPSFLAQYAAGCFLAVALSAMHLSGWRYLRLMAVVGLALTVAAFLLLCRETQWVVQGPFRQAAVCLVGAAACAVVWLFVNASQRDAVRPSQRLWPLLAGAAGLAAAIGLVLRPDVMIAAPGPAPGAVTRAAMAMTTALGAVLLGAVTAAMLLGHRYLTESDLSIVPLRRIAGIYLAALAVRVVWVAMVTLPLWTGSFRPRGEAMWFWLMMSIRVGVGILGLGVFAWMAWDCVRRRATQSATALFYLSMILALFGELAAQYLTRAEKLTL